MALAPGSAVRLVPFVVAPLQQSGRKHAEQSERRLVGRMCRKLRGNIEKYKEQKTKKEVPLNEEKFVARRQELDSEKEEEKQFEEQANGNEEIVKRDYYFNEVLNITVDYLMILGKDKVAQSK